MKRIVSMAALAAVAAGAAFADLKTSLNVRMGGNVVSHTMKDDSDNNSTKVMDLGSSDFGCDGLTFKASNDYAGLTLNWGTSLQTKENGKNQANLFWVSDGNGKGIEINAWLKPTDWLKFQVGAHKDGIFTADQVKKDTDDTNWSGAGKYAFLYKPGVITKASTGYFLDALTDVANGGQAYLFADFSFKDVGPGNLTIRPTFVSTGQDFFQKKDKKDSDVTMKTAPGLLVLYKIDDLITVNLDFQMPTNQDIAAGLYVSPSIVENLQLMVGGTVATNLSDETDKLGYKMNQKWFGVKSESAADFAAYGETYFAVDLRARYVAGDFHIANAFNYTGATGDNNVLKTTGTYGQGNGQIWDSIFLTYKLNDSWTITGNVQVDVLMGAKSKALNTAEDATILDLYVTPGVMYTVGKGATITCGVHVNFLDLTDGWDSKTGSTSISVPFLFRVKM